MIVKQSDEGAKKGRKFPHCLVAGIERYPRKVTKRMGQKKIARKCRIKPFVKHINYAHVMPTRYILGPELDLKNIVTDDAVKYSPFDYPLGSQRTGRACMKA